MPFPLTDEQRKIVDDRGGELLVSAAAGSGKTRVLVERLLDRVTGEGLDIDRFLVITYTRAAAAELRGRIAQELSDRLALTPGDRHLRRQTTLVYRAQISTIHAFCAALLRESGSQLDLDPDFRLCDEGEANVLMLRTLEEVLDRRYEDLDPAFALLADTLGAGRDDRQLVQIALDVFFRWQVLVIVGICAVVASLFFTMLLQRGGMKGFGVLWLVLCAACMVLPQAVSAYRDGAGSILAVIGGWIYHVVAAIPPAAWGAVGAAVVLAMAVASVLGLRRVEVRM